MEEVSKVTEWVTTSRKLSCQKKAFYSTLGHSSIPVQYSSPVVQSTNSTETADIQVETLDKDFR